MIEELLFCLWELMVKSCFSSEGGSETESTVDSDFGRGDLLAAASSDSFFSYKTRYSTVVTNLGFVFPAKFTLSLFLKCVSSQNAHLQLQPQVESEKPNVQWFSSVFA